MLCKLVGSGMEEKLSMFVFMYSPRTEYRSRQSPARVVVEVLTAITLVAVWSATHDIHVGVRAKSEVCFVREKRKSHWTLFVCDHGAKS